MLFNINTNTFLRRRRENYYYIILHTTPHHTITTTTTTSSFRMIVMTDLETQLPSSKSVLFIHKVITQSSATTWEFSWMTDFHFLF